MKN
ncbi:Protein of unknown function [Bacillus toyonensis]|jgi:hypothetical protein